MPHIPMNCDEDDVSTRGVNANRISDAAVASYKQNGFLCVRNVLTNDEVTRYRQAASELVEQMASYRKDAVLDQRVNVWRQPTLLGELTCSPRVAAIAERLAGKPLRLWHDQLLIKSAGDSAATEFHQDQPYWPHRNSTAPLTAWIALVDVPVERGCMSFLSGTHRLTELPRHELEHAHGLFDLVPELRWRQRVTIPLRAGDCTFHHGRTAHCAGPNRTEDPRFAHAIIYMDADTSFNGARHTITNPLGLTEDQPLDGELFPLVAQFASRESRCS